jgi:mercuric ion binding protein
MKRMAGAAVLFAALIVAAVAARAAERSVELAVENMWCASCGYIVRSVLEEVPGVERARVSYADKRAVVTYDDTRTDPGRLTEATAAAGFPSRPVRD